MAHTFQRLSESFFLRSDAVRVARDLLGKLLVVPAPDGTRVSGMIVETEAYMGIDDKAAHGYGGRRTPRNEITYAAGGHVYVFFIYGMYYQLNFVAGSTDQAHVVLVRGVEPIEGIEIMRERRGSMPDKNLTSGPGKLTISFGVDRSFNGSHLSSDRIWVEEYKNFKSSEISSGPRVGIDYAEDYIEMPWRFWVKGNQFVSKVPVKKVV